jgi:hypothetical protein
MIGLIVFTTIALLGAAFMLYVLAKFHEELKPPKRARQLHRESEMSEWRVLSPFARGTTSFAAPTINPEQIMIIESPHFGSIPLVRTVVSVGTRSSGRFRVCNS